VRRKKVGNKKVLLITNSSDLGEDVLRHGINLSKRMDAGLEVLHLVTAPQAKQAAEHFQALVAAMEPAEPLPYSQFVGQGEFVGEALDYARNKRNLLCVILYPDSDGGRERQGKGQRRFKEVMQMLNCPVVVYSGSPVYL